MKRDWRKVPCLKCGKKGLHHPDHPHAFGFKEYDKLVCRFCHAHFKIKYPMGIKSEGATP
jgi:hypothetical protein